MTRLVTRAQAIEKSRLTLGLPIVEGHDLVDDELLAMSVRRVASYACPCSAATLRSTLVEALTGLTDLSEDDLETRIDAAIEGLNASGDLLELSQVTSDDVHAKGTWLFCAPPSFVSLKESRRIFLIGMSRDEVTPLPHALHQRVQHSHDVRFIEPTVDEDLAARLRDIGWRELTIETWLRLPKLEDATAFKKAVDAKLAATSSLDSISELRILDRQASRQRYKDLWVVPGDHSGRFVCRRPQTFGSDQWGYVELSRGHVQRLLNLPFKNSLDRGCDTAWRLQLAIDATSEMPQAYRIRRDSEDTYFDFFGPVPLWVQRRLSTTGRAVTPVGCLLSYRVPDSAIQETETFMRRYVWMVPQSSV